MGIDSGKYPADDIVLLDNAGQKAERRRGFEDFAFVDHAALAFHRAGTQRRQAVKSLVQENVGSSRA